MRQGIWQCPNCLMWRSWKSFQKEEGVLDRRCIKCGQRVRTKLSRKPGRRGRKRKFKILELPSYMPPKAVKELVFQKNKHTLKVMMGKNEDLGYKETFIKAIDIKKPFQKGSGTLTGEYHALDEWKKNGETWREYYDKNDV